MHKILSIQAYLEIFFIAIGVLARTKLSRRTKSTTEPWHLFWLCFLMAILFFGFSRNLAFRRTYTCLYSRLLWPHAQKGIQPECSPGIPMAEAGRVPLLRPQITPAPANTDFWRNPSLHVLRRALQRFFTAAVISTSNLRLRRLCSE